ncbi:MAG: protein kinase [Pirellulaceae bacterium]|nr:protein kinase [Pirellulaceae bacterium]
MTSSSNLPRTRDCRPPRPEPRAQPAERNAAPVADRSLVLNEILGQGGSAVVYRAFDPQLGRSVAVKLLPPAAALDVQGRERFLREIRIAAALDHPHIVPVFATGKTDSNPYLEMQVIRGRSLSKIVADLQTLARNGQRLTGQMLLELAEPAYAQPPPVKAAAAEGAPLPPVKAARCYYLQVARWLAAIASALDHVHARGFLHADVKPANLLVEPGGQIWLIDFGTACELAAPAGGAGIVAAGTLPYLAPERLDGDAPPDVRQDVYGLGATLYELLTLRRPLEGQTAQALMRELVTRPPLRPRRLAPDVPRFLESIATRSLARRPEDRFATMADLEHALVDSVGCMSGAKYTSGANVFMRRAALAAAGLLMLVIATALYFTWPSIPSLDQRAANVAAQLPPGLQVEVVPSPASRVRFAGAVLLVGQPIEIPLDLTAGDKVSWQIHPRAVATHAGHGYTLTPHPTGWLAAEGLAQAWGGHLVAINGQAEQEFLNRGLLAKSPEGKYPIRWIGLSAADIRAAYRWSSGESLTFSNWNPNEPSRGWEVERYVAANWHVASGIDGDGQVGDWNDLPEHGNQRRGGYQGIIELPHTQQSVPPVLSIRSRGGARLAQLPATGAQLPAAGRIVIDLAGDAPQLIDVTITVE